MIKNKKLIFFSALLAVLVLAGILGFIFLDIQKGQAINMGDEGPACFVSQDCIDYGGYDGCTYGFGLKPCEDWSDCTNCGSSFDVTIPDDLQCSGQVCYVNFYGNWYPCGMCYSEPYPPEPPPGFQCEVEPNDFNNALYIKNPNGDTQFAITDGGHLLTRHGNDAVIPNGGVGNWIDTYISEEWYPNNNLPIYNGDTLVAFFHTVNEGDQDALYLRGIITEFEGSLEPQGAGNFIIKNSADMVVAYIDGQGNLHLMGCVNDNGYTEF